MSTKTTIKRIALVAVAALGFGTFTAIAPASAAPATVTSIVVGTVPQGRVGVTSAIPFKIYISGIAAGETLTINAEITSAPLSGGAANVASGLGSSWPSAAEDLNNDGSEFAVSSSSTSVAAFNAETLTHGRVDADVARGSVDVTADAGDGAYASNSPGTAVTDAQVAAGYIQGYVRINPDVTGTYTGIISTTLYTAGFGNSRTTAQNSLYNAGDKSASFTFSTTGAPTAVALATVAGGTIHGGSTNGSLVSVTLTGGTLGALDSIDLTASGTGLISKDVTSPASGDFAASKSLTMTDFAGGQTAYVLLKASGATAETVTLTASSSGALAAFSATKTYTVQAATGSATALVADVYGSDTTYGDANGSITGTAVTVGDKSTSQTLGWTWAGAAAKKGFYTVVDVQGEITGVANATYDVAYSTAATTEGLSISFAINAAALATNTNLVNVIIPIGSASTTIGMASATTYTVTSSTRVASGATFTITPTSAGSKYQVAAGGGVAMTATLKDKFGAAWAGQTVTITTSGRNNPVATTAVTDASGKVTFTSVDSSTSTTSLVDTVVFSQTNATSKTITLDYANTAASTVTLTGGNTTAGVNALTKTPIDIAAGAAGPSAATGGTVTATVKDASGNAIVGKLVTWTITGTGCALKSTSATSYTSTTGEATASSYAWLAGDCVVTATVGTVTGSATLTWAQLSNTSTGEARTISATVAGQVVTANVKDRFGNPIKGQAVYATKTGTGYFGSGLGRTTANTDASGNAEFSVAGGDATITVSLVDYDAVAGTMVGQSSAAKGYATNPTTTTAGTILTATTVGTATTAETGVGATFDAAGVASATVSVSGDSTAQTAADAAAEATDAANAATDAANAAAEAADAATAAAQDAADAVAALSAQVATLISGLKSQLTALTNLVIKIQKKVRA
jgi:hypothetical protein